MAVVHKLRRNVTDLNLNAGAGAGFRTVAWNPKVAAPVYGEVPEPVEETLTLLADCSSQDDLATKLQALDDMRRAADRYVRERTEQYPVWWHAKAYSETGERRALVRKVETEVTCPLVTRADWVENNRAVVRAKVTREGLWERTEPLTLPGATPSAAAAVAYDYTATADIVGDEGARIERFSILSPASGCNIGRLWMGIRSATLHGTVSYFEPIWECEVAGASLGTNAVRAPDGTASPGGGGNTKVTVTPGTATWAKRLSVQLQDVVANEDDNFGNFLWLLRTKVSSGTWEVHFRWGYSGMDDDDMIQGPIVELTNTGWDYVEMGTCRIPLRDYQILVFDRLSASVDSYYEVQMWARRTSGSGTLDLDCVCPIPIDVGYVISKGFDLGATYAELWMFAESPAGKSQAVAVDVNGLSSVPQTEVHNFRLPPGDGRLIIVYAGPTASVLTDTIQIAQNSTDKIYPRWLSLRGSE